MTGIKKQEIINIQNGDYSGITYYLQNIGAKKLMLVCDSSIDFLNIKNYLNGLETISGIKIIKFSDFKPNPMYESVVTGVDLFRAQQCDVIFAVGGGSAIDVAKCIKLYANMDSSKNYLKQKIVPNNIPLIAMPTTAGTGSEATKFAVIYYKDEKQSVSDESCIPSVVIMEADSLNTLPEYQKKSTMLDALCHAIESFWSVNSTDESKGYSKEAIRLILENKDAYFDNRDNGNANMLRAANIAGKAINITQTTAGHAMCYKLTSLYGIAHGHAAALCVRTLFPYMIKNTEKCADPRGVNYLESTFMEIAETFGCRTADCAAESFGELLDELEMPPCHASEEDFEILAHSVNPVRLKNNPVSLDEAAIRTLYKQILN